MATGRGPVTEGLGAEKLGIKMDRGYVVVDPMFKTNVPGISAIGDVITMGGPHYQLAHVSSMEGIVLAERIAGHAVQPINYDHVPRCTYTEPEIGSVGLTEAQAKAQGHEVRIGSFPFRALARARMAGETDGFVKIVAEKKYDEILGVHIIGPRATELVAEAVMALRMEVTVEELIKTIHAHPTMSEAVGEASHAAHGAAIHHLGAEQAMSTPVVMPQMGESIAEGTIVRWIKKVGDSVDRDEPLFEISTDKVDAEIPSPAAGVLTAIQVKEGETVPVNSVVATIGAAGRSQPRRVRRVPAVRTVPRRRRRRRDRHTRATRCCSRSLLTRKMHRSNRSRRSCRTASTSGTRREGDPTAVVGRSAAEVFAAGAQDREGTQRRHSQISGSGIGGRVTKQDILGFIENGGRVLRLACRSAMRADRSLRMATARPTPGLHQCREALAIKSSRCR